MNAAMLGEINEIARHGHRAYGRIDYSRGVAGESDDTAVMIGIAGAMENKRAADACDGAFDGCDGIQIAPFGEVRNAFEKGSQAAPALQRVRLMARLPSRMAMAT
jgi:hypothetical protein